MTNPNDPPDSTQVRISMDGAVPQQAQTITDKDSFPSSIISPSKHKIQAKPSVIPFPPHLQTPDRPSSLSSAASITIRPIASVRSSQDSITLKPTSYVRHLIEYNRILADLDRRSCSASLETRTAVPFKRLEEVAIDEVDVETCVLCGKESMRDVMQLKEVDPHGGQMEGGKGFLRRGVWWVCKGECKV